MSSLISVFLPFILVLCLSFSFLLSSSFVPISAQSTSPVLNIAIVCHGDPSNMSDYMYHPLSFSALNIQSFIRGAALWGRTINLYQGIPLYDVNNTRVLVHLTFFNIGNTSQTARATAVSQRIVTGYYGLNYSIIICPGFSLDNIVIIFMSACETTKSCLAIAPLTPSTAVFVCIASLPPDCARAGNRRFQYGFSVLYDGNYALSAHLSIFRQNGLNNVALLYSSQPYGVLAAAVTSDTMFGLGMNSASSTMFSNSTSWTLNDALYYVYQLQQAKVEALCILSNGADTIALSSLLLLFQAFKQVGWLPAAIALAGSIGPTLATSLGNAEFAYVFTSAQWDWHLKGRAYTTINSTYSLELYPATATLASPAVFRQTILNYWNTSITDANLVYAADSVQALTFAQKFIELAGAYDIESMRSASKQVSVTSINGQLQLDTAGRTVVSDALVFQSLNNGSRLIISPLSIGVNPVLPMPQFSDRVFVGRWFSQSIEQLVLGINTVLMVYVIALVLGFILYRKRPVMKASTPSFCILMSLGGMVMLASVYGTGLYVTTAACQAQYWLLSVGFSLMFGALFMKTFRVWRIFNAGHRLKQVAITNNLLFVHLLALLSFDIILNIIWSAMSAFPAVYVTVDVNRPVNDYIQCDTSGESMIFLMVAAIEKAALILAGIVLTIATRNVPSKFNETPYLATAIYNCALLCAFVVPIVVTGIGNRSVSYAIRCLGIDLLVFSTLSIVFVPKFYLIFGDAQRLKAMEKINAENHINADGSRQMEQLSNRSHLGASNQSGTVMKKSGTHTTTNMAIKISAAATTSKNGSIDTNNHSSHRSENKPLLRDEFTKNTCRGSSSSKVALFNKEARGSTPARPGQIAMSHTNNTNKDKPIMNGQSNTNKDIQDNSSMPGQTTDSDYLPSSRAQNQNNNSIQPINNQNNTTATAHHHQTNSVETITGDMGLEDSRDGHLDGDTPPGEVNSTNTNHSTSEQLKKQADLDLSSVSLPSTTVASLVSKSLRLSARVAEYNAVLARVTEELERRKKNPPELSS